MAPRTLLVPLLGVDTEMVALGTAFVIARGFESHVEAVYIRPDPRDSLLLLGDGLTAGVIEQILRSAETAAAKRSAAARQRFDDAVASAEFRVVDQPTPKSGGSARWREVIGEADRLVIDEGRLSDLIVIARPACDQEPAVYDCLESALLFCGRPVLMVPAEPPRLEQARVAIAWDGGLEAARAVTAALPFLHRAVSIQILTINAKDSDGTSAARLVGYLACHGLSATVVRTDAGNETAGAAILHKAAEIGADLLVMGAYGHSRMRELILGGVTRHILAHAEIPVLMAH